MTTTCSMALAQEPITELETIEVGGEADGGGSLVSPDTGKSSEAIRRVPGGAEVIPDTAFKTSTPATTVKDVLDYVPGAFTQTRWGTDTRLSIRGSALSRNYGLRGVQMMMDGIPLLTADGFGDFAVIDPGAYRHVEVYKGANALRYGGNSLGGAVNFVSPTGHDAEGFGGGVDFGSFGFRKVNVHVGGVAGSFDYYGNLTALEEDGFRDHSEREGIWGNANVGYRFSEDFETRFYLSATSSDQRMPGQITRAQALSDPSAASAFETLFDHQRNIDTLLYASKSTLRLAPDTTLEFGAFGGNRQVDHPIFRWIDYAVQDYGGFARLSDERTLFGRQNRLVAGINAHNGSNDDERFETLPGAVKGPLETANLDRSQNYTFYAENSFFLLPDVALVAGVQYLHAVRDRTNRGGRNPDPSGSNSFDAWSPKVGVLWNVDPDWQVFANVSRSAEVPSFGDDTVGGVPFRAEMQESTTYEIGTRGQRESYRWDLSLYRADIRNELQCITTAPWSPCTVTNADRTVHQGVELGLGLELLGGVFQQQGRSGSLWFDAAYTFNDFRFDDDRLWGDNELPGAPRHVLRAQLLYQHQSGFFFGPNLEWVPQGYFVDNANTLETDGYAIWGLKLGYERGNFSAYLEGRNLLDKAYISSASVGGDLGGADGNYFNPGTGRAVYAGMKMRW